MTEPNSQDPEFGSEVLRRETPEHRRLRRRNGIVAAVLGSVAAVVTLIAGIRAMPAGEMVPGHSNSGHGASLPLPGEIVCLMGLFVLVLCIWSLWRLVTNKA
jgi:hypothetical protein